MSRHSISRKRRQRREFIQFDSSLRQASPSMHQDLLAAAAHQHQSVVH